VPKPWIGGEYHTIKGSILSPEGQVLAGMTGKWTETTHWTSASDPKTPTEVMFSVANNKPPKPKFTSEAEETDLDSHKLWGKAAEYLAAGNYKEATREKTAIEEAQRKLRKDREAAGEEWQPALFRMETPEETATGMTGIIDKKGKKDGPEWSDWVAKGSLHHV